MTSSYMQPAAEFSDGTFYLQQRGGECRWQETDRDGLLAALASSTPPAFRSVLAITQHDDNGEPSHYSGAMYFDFDGEDIAEATEAFQRFLAKLRDLGLDLAAVRFYATGGRGYHIEIAPSSFLGKLPSEGIKDLPKIFREVAHQLYVDCLDLRVYSCGRGRMWRTPNVQRENGLYKVPLTTDEATTVTPELYVELCSAPRPHPELAPASFCPALAKIFTQARDTLAASANRKRSASKTAAALKQRFVARGAPLPPSLLALGAGRIPPREGAGWNMLALQIAATARAMDTDEDTLVELCATLIRDHESDGTRYNSPRKREAELRRMFSYLDGAPYDASVGGIRSILPRGIRCNDLKGL